MKTLALASLVLAAAASAVSAAGFADNLEGATPAGTTRSSGVTGVGTSSFSTAGEPARDTRSHEFALADVDTGFARLSYTAVAGPAFGRLRDVSASFETFIDSSTDLVLTPYVLLGLDNNGNGTYESATESLVIQFTSSVAGTPATNTWLAESLTSANGVHVQVNRGLLPGDGDNDFQPDETADLLSELYDTSFNGATLWGDLDVRFVRIGAGNFAGGAGDQDYLAYIDNVALSVVPEPTTLAAIAGAGVLGLRRRRA